MNAISKSLQKVYDSVWQISIGLVRMIDIKGRPMQGVCMAVALGLLAGCGPVLQNGVPLTQILAEDAVATTGEYQIQPGDQIEVHHILDSDYSAVVTVAPDGKIIVPGISRQIGVLGFTLNELTEKLNKLYRDSNVLSRPFFSLTFRSSANTQVFVSGEVQRPGYLDLGGGERHVLQVLASAGGFLPTARTNEVIIVRSLSPGKPEIFSVDIDKIVHGTDLSQNVRVHPLDVVLVPRSDVASLDVWVDQHIRLALPIPTSGSLVYTNNPATSILK
jgi:protein involved in polysaccharide export with SLBB domain